MTNNSNQRFDDIILTFDLIYFCRSQEWTLYHPSDGRQVWITVCLWLEFTWMILDLCVLWMPLPCQAAVLAIVLECVGQQVAPCRQSVYISAHSCFKADCCLMFYRLCCSQQDVTVTLNWPVLQECLYGVNPSLSLSFCPLLMLSLSFSLCPCVCVCILVFLWLSFSHILCFLHLAALCGGRARPKCPTQRYLTFFLFPSP